MRGVTELDRKGRCVRVVYLHQYFNTLEMPGGTRSLEFARRLVKMGHSVDLLTSDRVSGSGSDGWRVTIEEGVRVHWTPVAYSNVMSYPERMLAFGAYALRSAARAAKIPADVIFASSTPLTIALPGAHAARRQRAPMVLEVRDLWPEVPLALGALKNPAMRWAARRLEAYAYAHADRVVALSPGMREGVVAAGYPAGRVTVIPNACDTALFAGSAEGGQTLRSRDPWIGDRPLVVYTGTVGLVNGVDYLVRIAAAMRQLNAEVRFLIVGSGRCLSEVVSLAKSLGVVDVNVRFLSELPKKEMPAVLGAATIAVSTVIDVPELHANSANKVFDAFAAGVPVAINHEGWLADLLRSSEAGLVVPPTDPSAAALVLNEVLGDSDRLHSMAMRSRELAHTRFDRDALAASLEQVLASAVATNRKR